MTKLSKPFALGGYDFLGVDDWLCFVRTPAGDVAYLSTECVPQSRRLPDAIDPETAEGVLATAMLMIEDGVRPELVDPDLVDSTEAYFAAVQS